MNLDALIFMPALVGSVICGFVFLTFAAHYYLTVLEGTAAGAKEIPWQSEPLTSNFWKVFYLGWLIGLWAGPAYVIGRAAAPGDQWVKLSVALLTMWALYPVSQMSSLSASSVWVPLNLDVFARLAQKPGVTAGFFLLALPVVALGGVAFKWAFLTNGDWHMLFVGVPLLVFAALLYARLLGRLAFALMFTRDLLKRKKKKKPSAMDATPPASRERPPPPVEVGDTRPIVTPDGELDGYNVLIADDPPAPKKRIKAQVIDEPAEEPLELVPEPPPPPVSRKRAKPARAAKPERTWTDEDDDKTPYGVNASEVKDEERVPQEVVKPRAEEMALLDRRDAPKPPKQVWSPVVLAFLAQPGTISALMILAALGTAAGVMVRIARAFDPTAGAE